MTIQEMHYDIDQGLQKVASFVYSNFEPEEIDRFINKMIERFIKDRFDRTDPAELGFEKNIKRLEDIQTLIVPFTKEFVESCATEIITEQVFKDNNGDPTEWTSVALGGDGSNNTSLSHVTFEYTENPIQGTVSARVLTGFKQSAELWWSDRTARFLSDVARVKLKFRFERPENGSYFDIAIRNNASGDDLKVRISDGSYGVDFQSIEVQELTVPVSAFIGADGVIFNKLGIITDPLIGTVYFDDIRLEIEVADSLCVPGGLLLGPNQGTTLSTQDFIPEYMFFVGAEANVGYDECRRRLDADSDYELPMRLVTQEDLFRAKRDPFRKSSPENGGMLTLFDNTLKLHPSKRFIYKSVTVYYIRKPQEVSLALSSDCDLAEHTHDEIVDLTVQHILEVIASPRYQSNSAQAKKTE